MFVGVGFRDNGVVWLEESVASWREKMLRIEIREFGMDNVVNGDMLGGGVAVIPFEMDDTVAGGPCGDVCCPESRDEVGLPLC